MALFTTAGSSSPMAAIAALHPPRFFAVRTSSHGAVSMTLLRVSCSKRRAFFFSRALSVRCEQQSTKQGGGGGGGTGVDVWASRLAMVGFAAAVLSEVATGKGLIENFGVVASVPALALVATALVGGLAVLFISRSGSQD